MSHENLEAEREVALRAYAAERRTFATREEALEAVGLRG